MYAYWGYKYDKESDDRLEEMVGQVNTDINMKYVREHEYTNEHRKKLDDFDTLAKQMIGQRFGFFSGDGTVLSKKL